MCVTVCVCLHMHMCMHINYQLNFLLRLVEKNSPFNLMQASFGERAKLKFNDTWKKEAETQQFEFNPNELHSNWVWTVPKPNFTELSMNQASSFLK